jgi:hypothetical protein
MSYLLIFCCFLSVLSALINQSKWRLDYSLDLGSISGRKKHLSSLQNVQPGSEALSASYPRDAVHKKYILAHLSGNRENC